MRNMKWAKAGLVVLLVAVLTLGYGGCSKSSGSSSGSSGGTPAPVTPSSPSSNAPDKASNPSPSDGATGAPGSSSPIYLAWTTSNAASQDFYLGTTNPPPFDRTISNTTLDVVRGIVSLTGLAKGTTYYWRVNTKNYYGIITTGDVWSFTTSPY